MESLPDARPLPVPQAPPARHPGATAHLLGQRLPRDPGPEHEENAREDLPAVERFAARIPSPATFGWGKEWFDDGPQRVVQ